MPKSTNQLHKEIAERIRAQGPISVAEYMGLAAEAYYKTQEPFGAAGDFTTAPEISQMFGELIALWLVDLWMQMGQPAAVKLIELGPGKGTLAADILRTIAAWPDFRAAVTLHLVETSARLREIQAVVLKEYHPAWYGSFSEVPEGFCFVIANEFFDALPVQQFVKTEEGWRERCVGYDEGKDAFFFTHPAEAVSEASPISQTIIKQISDRIANHGGAALIVDYGHAESGPGDTLQALSKHKYANPLENPGEYDITAHVDFAALKKAAAEFVRIMGPVTQGQFLVGLGIAERAQKLCAKATEAQRQDIMSALKRLVAPNEMGRLFKVMALIPKAAKIEPAGFLPLPTGEGRGEG
jgi:NADH dehydrogenase [ubiquinone] 1 alpha subcomplex assembly factor 7